MNGKSGMTVVEASIVVALLLLVVAISAPALIQNREKKQAARCALNLDALAAACRAYAAANGGYPARLSDLVPAHLDAIPACPAGGTYSPGTSENDPPACSVPGHRL